MIRRSLSKIRKILFLFCGIMLSQLLFSQGNIEDLLYTEVDNLNPVYKPVIGFGAGVFNFMGDVQDPYLNPLNGPLGYTINLATFVDNKQYLRANFFFMLGALSGNERSYEVEDITGNMNFRSDILVFGVNLNYDFDNFYKTYRMVHPYISAGVEIITFNSKIDYYGSLPGNETEDIPYQYWRDGTIRNLPYSSQNVDDPSLRLMSRDYEYETVLRGNEQLGFEWGAGDYNQYTLAVPLEAGLDFWISNRILFRVGVSYHITFTDLIDHVSSENTSGKIGAPGNDNFLYTSASLHFDLFSSKKTLAINRMFADIDLDLTLIGDEDGDSYMDGWDNCPGTPFGVLTDTLGCPLDNDYDQVPNYVDDEPESRYGAYVDERGVEIPEEELIKMLDMSAAVDRRDVALYLREPGSYAAYQSHAAQEIPEKFLSVDSDGDGYISFDEIMDEIDGYFDFESDLEPNDLYELNDFFFAQ